MKYLHIFICVQFLALCADAPQFEENIIFPEHEDISHIRTGLQHLDLSFVPRAKGAIGSENVQQKTTRQLDKVESALQENSSPRTIAKTEPSEDSVVDQKLQEAYGDSELANKEISLQTKEMNIKDLLNTIGKAIGINLMVDPRVKGVLGSLNLKNCGAGQALRLICKQAKPEAAVVKDGNVWNITTREDARNMLKEALKQAAPQQKLKVYPVNHAHVDKAFEEKVASGWKQISKNQPGEYMQIDKENKQIYARSQKPQLKQFKQYLREVDKPVLQVRIDVIVVLASKDFFFEFGIDWSGIYNREKTVQARGKSFDFWGLGGTLLDFPDPKGVDSSTSSTPTPVVPDPPNKHNPNLFVNPLNWAFNLFNSGTGFYSSDDNNANNRAGLIRLPFVFGGPDLSLRRLNLVLNMAEMEEKVNIITRPSILTSNNKSAKILIGQSLPLQTTIEDLTASSTRNITTINYKDTGIVLEVKPVVNPDRKSVYLDILVENSVLESGSTKANEKGVMEDPPTISVIKTKNEVILKNGQTTIIGGLSSKQTGSIKRSVPFLSRLPVIGELFKSNVDANYEKERYIFITPKIIEYEV